MDPAAVKTAATVIAGAIAINIVISAKEKYDTKRIAKRRLARKLNYAPILNTLIPIG